MSHSWYQMSPRKCLYFLEPDKAHFKCANCLLVCAETNSTYLKKDEICPVGNRQEDAAAETTTDITSPPNSTTKRKGNTTLLYEQGMNKKK